MTVVLLRLDILEISRNLSPNEKRGQILARNREQNIRWMGRLNERRMTDLLNVLNDYKRDNLQHFTRKGFLASAMHGISLGGQ
ncbi:MAG: hypothetical protein ABIG39_04060 [Candidatus Micrarchaeota archaeon]